MFRTCFFSLTALTVAIAATPAAAQSPVDVQPGMWEYSMEISMPGMPNKMPPQTFSRCLSAQDVAQNKHFSGDRGGKNPCTISNMKNSGGKFSYDMLCKTEHGTMTGTASGSASSTAMEMESKMKMSPPTAGMSEMQQKMKARRIGNC